MSDYDDTEDNEREEEEEAEPIPTYDYNEIDPDTGFKKVELNIWHEYLNWVRTPEEEREDQEIDTWIENYAAKTHIKQTVIKSVTTIGIYSGERDEFNQRHSKGWAIFVNTDEYRGHYIEGKRSGEGLYIYKSQSPSAVDKKIIETAELPEIAALGDIRRRAEKIHEHTKIPEIIIQNVLQHGEHPFYEGSFEENKKHGNGTMKFGDGAVYKGEWAENKMHGFGEYFYPNGDRYTGNWANGLKSGNGEYYFAEEGSKYVGEWNQGDIVQGQWQMSDGTVYTGQFTSNIPNDVDASITFSSVDPDKEISNAEGNSKIRVQGAFQFRKWHPQPQFLTEP